MAAYVELSSLEAEIGGFSGPGGPRQLLSNFPSFWPCMKMQPFYLICDVTSCAPIRCRNFCLPSVNFWGLNSDKEQPISVNFADFTRSRIRTKIKDTQKLSVLR